jgi:hypothetical protein
VRCPPLLAVQLLKDMELPCNAQLDGIFLRVPTVFLPYIAVTNWGMVCLFPSSPCPQPSRGGVWYVFLSGGRCFLFVDREKPGEQKHVPYVSDKVVRDRTPFPPTHTLLCPGPLLRGPLRSLGGVDWSRQVGPLQTLWVHISVPLNLASPDDSSHSWLQLPLHHCVDCWDLKLALLFSPD